MTQLNLSARVYHRILKLARTIADPVRSEEIRFVHLAETLHPSSSEDYNGLASALTAIKPSHEQPDSYKKIWLYRF